MGGYSGLDVSLNDSRGGSVSAGGLAVPSKFLMKNNLIKDPPLPSASGRPGHTRQRGAARPAAGRQRTRSCPTLGNDRRRIVFSLRHYPGRLSHHCYTFLVLGAMNQHLRTDLSSGFVHMLNFCMENMPFSTQIPRLERLSLAAELRIPKPLPACRCLALYSQKNMARRLSKLSQKAQKSVNISLINILDFRLKIQR